MIVHIDTSALGRLYLGDQSDSVQLSHTVRDGDRPVITSELTDVEMASTLAGQTGTARSLRSPHSTATPSPSPSRSGTSYGHRCAPWTRSTWPLERDSVSPLPTRCGCCPVTTGKTRRHKRSASRWSRTDHPRAPPRSAAHSSRARVGQLPGRGCPCDARLGGMSRWQIRRVTPEGIADWQHWPFLLVARRLDRATRFVPRACVPRRAS